MKHIRNFSIIAHIDHGKSTLSDRLIEYCKGVEMRDMKAQILDQLDIERERGITVKAQTVRLMFQAKDGDIYQLNLLDTPGHVDFSYEVSRSLSACEGSLLIVDAAQGVEAQTLANTYSAIEQGHEIITVFNKIDLPAADIDRVKSQVEDIIGLSTDNAVAVSAKKGIGIPELLENIVKYLPAPEVTEHEELQALLIDSWYDNYLGTIVLVRVLSGTIKPQMNITFKAQNKSFIVDKIGYFTPKMVSVDELKSGEIGYVTASIKNLKDAKVGDTIIDSKHTDIPALPGFKEVSPVVFSSFYPMDGEDYNDLKVSLEKLNINDSSFTFEVESSPALGFGFRCGFLGLLHLEVIQERLEREYSLVLIVTLPSVTYKVRHNDGSDITIYSPTDMPDANMIQAIQEPMINANIIVPEQYLGNILTLCSKHRGVQVSMNWSGSRALLVYRMPLNEVVFDFYNKLKSASQGYASFDYEIDGFSDGDLVKVSILINHEAIEALSFIAHRSSAVYRGRKICEKLKTLIPKQMFAIPIQAAIGGKIIARETISAFRKDVTAKCYGGDITRKRKLLEKQKAGKKRMRQFGSIEIPHSTFIKVLQHED